MSTKTQLGVRTTQHAPRNPAEPRSHEYTTANQSDQPFHTRISERAYALYEQHGREDGHALDHWLEAERQVISQGS